MRFARIAVCTFTLVLVAASSFAVEPVTVSNFVRAETDYDLREVSKGGKFGKLVHDRGPSPVNQQTVIRLNRDTPYSSGVFDLTSPLTIVKPDSEGRFQSLMVINQDHYVKLVAYDPGEYLLTQETVGTRYCVVAFRTFMDPNSPNDVAAAHALQDRIRTIQADPGKLELPNWDPEQRKKIHDLLVNLASMTGGFDGAFGDVKDVDPVMHLIGTAAGWGGNPEKDAKYLGEVVKRNDGKTPYVLTVPAQVPVDGFWSITVYNAQGFYEAPETAISVNSTTAKKNADGTTTIRFGGDPKQPNFLGIMPGWNYTVRLYRPRKEIQDGTWKFPPAVPAK